MNLHKIINNKFLVAGVSIILFVSCSKNFITKTPNDSTSSDIALGSASGLQTALNGAYAEMRVDTLFGRDFPVDGDLMADNTFVETSNSGRYTLQFTYRFTSTDGVVSGGWFAAYETILDCNRIIDAEVSGTDVIKAQAYAIRALMYFKLVNIYARPYTEDPNGLGVPLIIHYDPNLLPTRATVQAVYTQIINDLKTAFQSAPDYTNSVTLSKYAIEGLLARAYLYMGDKANAKTAALDVINNGGFTMVNTAAAYQAFWGNSSIQQSKQEVMFEVDCNAVNNNGTNDLGAFYNGGYTDLYASQQLVSLYSAGDIRTSVLIPGITKSNFPATLVGKYPNYGNADKDNLKVIRIAEVYLIAAEASLPDNETDAKFYLNKLMSNRDTAFYNAGGYTSTGAQLLSDIVTERRKELAFEGDRYYDMNRLKLDINRGPANAGSIPPILSSIPYSDYRRVFPIPNNEIQANANIATQQNPGFQ